MIVEKNIYEGYAELMSLWDKSEANVYQDKDYFKFYMKSQSFRVIGLRPEISRLEFSYSCLLLYSKENLVCGFPYRYSKKKNEVQFIWDQKSINNLIYDAAELKQSHVDELFVFLLNRYPDCRIFLQNVDRETLFYKLLKSSCAFVKEEKLSESVSICVKEGFDVWYDSLSKSTKQNLRTAYNRLKTDNVSYQIDHFSGKIPVKITFDIMYLQRKRNLEKSGRNYGILTKFLCFCGAFLSFFNPRTQMLLKTDRNFLLTFKVENKLAGFCAGFCSSNGRFLIPFLKFNSEFKRYSPGGIVIKECIKELSCQRNFSLRQFDLLTGDEPYKYTYGGVAYSNAFVVLKKK